MNDFPAPLWLLAPQRTRFRSLLLGTVLVVLLAASAPLAPPATPNASFEGTWQVDKEQSSSLDTWDTFLLDIKVDGPRVTIKRHLTAGRFEKADSMTLETGGAVNRVPVARWLDNRHLGVFVDKNTVRRVTAEWIDEGRTLQVVSRFPVRTSQGKAPVRILSEYRLAPDERSLSLLQLRSTRPKPVYYTFRRAEAKEAS